MDVNSIKPGQVIVYHLPQNPARYGSEPHDEAYQVKANIDGKLYGKQLTDINEKVHESCYYKTDADNFDVIA